MNTLSSSGTCTTDRFRYLGNMIVTLWRSCGSAAGGRERAELLGPLVPDRVHLGNDELGGRHVHGQHSLRVLRGESGDGSAP